VRFLTRLISPADYDDATRRRPELCPLFYMGDRRSGQELLNGFDTDAAVSIATLAGGGDGVRPATLSNYPVAGSEGGLKIINREGLLDRIAAVVEGLAAEMAAAAAREAGRGGLSEESWNRVIHHQVATSRCALHTRARGLSACVRVWWFVGDIHIYVSVCV
jgi:hypothetical protein